ncbi:hypothetical protein C5167_041735 [Papaver somniferum]|nr:hypothetical protein C5167_041735 [Papaver somniferum]
MGSGIREDKLSADAKNRRYHDYRRIKETTWSGLATRKSLSYGCKPATTSIFPKKFFIHYFIIWFQVSLSFRLIRYKRSLDIRVNYCNTTRQLTRWLHINVIFHFSLLYFE